MTLHCGLTFDFDAMSVWLGSYKSRNPSMISRGEFGAIAVPRILDLLKKHDLQATFCVPGHTALAYPDIVRRIDAEGHEIAHHGWVHENPADFSEAEERANLDRGLDALHRGCPPARLSLPLVGFLDPHHRTAARIRVLLRQFADGGGLHPLLCPA